jgi:hypothetical protein
LAEKSCAHTQVSPWFAPSRIQGDFLYSSSSVKNKRHDYRLGKVAVPRKTLTREIYPNLKHCQSRPVKASWFRQQKESEQMASNSKEIMDRLTPKHLQEEIEDDTRALKRTIEMEVGEKETLKKEIQKNDPKMQLRYTFSINWTDNQGKIWKGEFVNKILSIRERQMVGVMRSRLGNALPSESLDLLTQELNLMVAHLMFSLEVKPDWAEDLRDLQHVELLQTIYMEVASHEAMFFGGRQFTSEG